MSGLSVTSKIMPAHMVPRVVLFLHFRTPCSQHTLYSVDEDQLAVKKVVLAGSVVGPMKEAIALLMEPSALSVVV